MKRLRTVLICLCALCALGLFASAAAAYALGDVDGSGEVAVDDARLALRAAVGLETYAPDSEEFAAADVDYSGELDVSDARGILRAAVGLEDLADRLPESASLTEEEILEKDKAGILYCFIHGIPGLGKAAYGFVISNDGVVVLRFSDIRYAVSITCEDDNGITQTAKEVLAVDKTHDLALVRFPGTFTPIALNSSYYKDGDPVYTIINGRIRKGKIITKNEILPNSEIEGIRSSFTKELAYSNDHVNHPLLDRFGRAIGFCFVSEDKNDREVNNHSIPVSVIRNMKNEPMTMRQFTDLQYATEILPENEEVEVLPCATLFMPVFIHCEALPYHMVFKSVETEGNIFDCELLHRKDEKYILKITVGERNKNGSVTIYTRNGYSAASRTIQIKVTEDGYVNTYGHEVIPDPGPIFNVSPNFTSSEGNTIYFSFGIDELERSPFSREEMFYRYAGTLEYMGFEYIDYNVNDDGVKYEFQDRENRIYIWYSDWEYGVSIYVSFESEEAYSW